MQNCIAKSIDMKYNKKEYLHEREDDKYAE